MNYGILIYNKMNSCVFFGCFRIIDLFFVFFIFLLFRFHLFVVVSRVLLFFELMIVIILFFFELVFSWNGSFIFGMMFVIVCDLGGFGGPKWSPPHPRRQCQSSLPEEKIWMKHAFVWFSVFFYKKMKKWY